MFAKATLALAAFSALAAQVASAVIVTDHVVVYKTVYYDPAQAAAPTPPAEVNVAPQNAQNQAAKTTLATVVKAAPKPSATSKSSATSETPSSKSTAATGSKAVADSSSVQSIDISHKRGLAYNDANQANGLGCSNCGWGWNWDSNSAGLDSSYSYVPMLWSNADVHTQNWDSNVENAISTGSKAIFSFNEPDNAGQANMSPETASSLHQQYLNKYQGRVQIGAPAISNSGNPGEGVEWLRNFFQACGDSCAVDFCPVHWYSDVQYTETLFQHLDDAHDACGGRPIWLTEFAPNDGTPNQDIITFLNNVIPRLDSLDYLDAYSYFMVDNRLMTSNGPSDFGSTYISL